MTENQWIRDTSVKRLREAVIDLTQINDLTRAEMQAIELERDTLSRVLDKQKELA